MPFQSEKQRRFLHANHPEIAKRWERDYAHGGILDINESEEIISDDGNDIELTDYNAAFDEPTGVKSLFQAKDGGRIGYQWGGPGGKSPGTSSTGGMRGESNRERGIRQAATQPSAPKSSPVGDYRGQHDWDVVTKPGEGDVVVDIGPEREEAYVMVGGQKVPQSVWGTSTDPREKYDTEEQMLDGIYAFNPTGATKKHNYIIGKKKSTYEQALAAQKAKMKKMGIGKLIPALIVFLATGGNIKLAMNTISVSKKDMLTAVQYGLPVMKAKKEYMTALGNAKEDYEELGMASHHHAVDTEIQTIDQELLDLTRTKDEEDTKGDGGIELPPQLGGPSTKEMAIEYPDWWGAIKAGQQKQKDLLAKIEREKLAREENPIVSGTESDIIMIGNSGGLANLFRVKNQ